MPADIDDDAQRRDKRVLITGLRGFTGHYLAQQMHDAGYRVFGTAHGGEALSDGVFEVDLCDRARVGEVIAQIRPHAVVHLAAISFVAHGDTEAIYRTNIVGTRNLLEALAQTDVRPQSILLASSANIYGNAAAEVIDERVPPAPANDYAVSKLAMEYMARLWFDRLPVTIVRPFNYTGIGQGENFLLPKIVAHYRRGERHIELGNLDVARDFSDVRMVAATYRRLVQSAPAGQIFNVCSGVAYTLQEVLDMMADIAGYAIDVRVNPDFVRASEVRCLRGSAEKLHRLIGDAQLIPLRDTLEWMYRA